jgi:RNA-directed DNA polymerase
MGIQEFVVGVFDCDNEKFMNANALAAGTFHRLNAAIYACCLGRASGLDGLFCIETLYPRDATTRLTSDGRRLFFRDEFHPETGMHESGLYKRDHPKRRELVVSDRVIRLSDQQSVGLSKLEFAELVANRVTPFEDMDFSGFAPTFDVFAQMAEDVRTRSGKH